jgi:hypothetical protein
MTRDAGPESAARYRYENLKRKVRLLLIGSRISQIHPLNGRGQNRF